MFQNLSSKLSFTAVDFFEILQKLRQKCCLIKKTFQKASGKAVEKFFDNFRKLVHDV